MTAYYLDSSAVIKRYVTESGGQWVESLCAKAQDVVILSELAMAEVGSAFARMYRGKHIADEQRKEYLDVFLQDCRLRYRLVPVDRSLIERAVNLAQRHYLRGYDSVQLACALVSNDGLIAKGLSSLVFVTADDALIMAAQEQGLSTENPNLH